MDRIKAMTINIDADSGVDARFQAVCSSTDDANLLAAALQAGLMYRRYRNLHESHAGRARSTRFASRPAEIDSRWKRRSARINCFLDSERGIYDVDVILARARVSVVQEKEIRTYLTDRCSRLRG